MIEHLAGRLDRPAAVELVQRRTRQLAKRQMTWFRGLEECRFLPVGEPFDAAAVAARISDL